MKALKCALCDHEESAETFEGWMEALKPHYKRAHADDMEKHMHLPEKEQQALMKKWMVENKARFDATN